MEYLLEEKTPLKSIKKYEGIAMTNQLVKKSKNIFFFDYFCYKSFKDEKKRMKSRLFALPFIKMNALIKLKPVIMNYKGSFSNPKFRNSNLYKLHKQSLLANSIRPILGPTLPLDSGAANKSRSNLDFIAKNSFITERKGNNKEKSKKYDTAYSKLSEVKLITIGLASSEKIRQWAEKTLSNGKVLGRVTNANTLHHKTFKPQKGGLFCERIFGPLKDFQCACGTNQKNSQANLAVSLTQVNISKETQTRVDRKPKAFYSRHPLGALEQGIKDQSLEIGTKTNTLFPTLQGPKAQVSRQFCKKCDVEYTWSVIRRYQLGYLQLVSPVTHIWYLKGNPSYLSILLDMKKRHLSYVTYCTESITLENAIKGNSSRLTKIPSQMLSIWQQIVQNTAPINVSSSQINSLSYTKKTQEDSKEARGSLVEVTTQLPTLNNLTETKENLYKNQKLRHPRRALYLKTKIQKRKLPVAMKTFAFWNSIPSYLVEKKKVGSKLDFQETTEKKLLILFLLIHKTIYESLYLDLLDESTAEDKIDLASFAKSQGDFPPSLLKHLTNQGVKEYLNKVEQSTFSVKKLLKKLPPSLYLFLNLQLIFQKQLLLATKNKLWKTLYKTSLKESYKKFLFLYGCTLWNNINKNGDLPCNLFTNPLSKVYLKPKASDLRQPKVALKGLKLKANKSFKENKFSTQQIGLTPNRLVGLSLLRKKQQLSSFTCDKPFLLKEKSLLVLSMVKFKWFSFFLMFYKKMQSKDLFILNYKLLNNSTLSHQDFIDVLSQNWLNLSYKPFSNKATHIPSKKPLAADIRHPKGALVNSLHRLKVKAEENPYTAEWSRTLPEVGLEQKLNGLPFLPNLEKFSESLLHVFFTILVKENIYNFKNYPTTRYPAEQDINLPEVGLEKENVSPIGDKLALLSTVKNLVKKDFSSEVFNKLSTKQKLFLTSVKKQYNLYNDFSYFINKKPRLSQILRHPLGAYYRKPKAFYKILNGEYIYNSILSSASLLSRSTKDPKRETATSLKEYIKGRNSTLLFGSLYKNRWSSAKREKPKLVNNIYSLSHRERWMDEEWQNFSDYMLVSSTVNEFGLKEVKVDQRDTNSNSSRNSVRKRGIQSGSYFNIIPAYKNRIFTVSAEQFFQSELGANLGGLNTACYSGPGIVQQLLNEFDLSELGKIDKQNRILLYQLNKHLYSLKKRLRKAAKKELKECYKKRDQLIRRTKLIRTFFRKDSTPHSMILTILPVLPPDLRPIVKIGGQIAASDLNRLYQRVIYRNDRLQKFLKEPTTSYSYEMKYAQRLLQEAVDNLIQNGKSSTTSEKDARGRALKSLSDLLKGKQGRFRQYLLGKRVDYSGRSVIVVGPKLQIHECGLPKEMALELYLPFLLKRLLNHNYARTVVGAKALMKKDPDLIWELLKEIMQTCPVLLNRAPTLHRLGIQAFQPKLIEGRAILLHPLVCPAFNADFDGDQMAVHVPITVEARAEAWKLMCARLNFLSPATGEPLAIPSQDMVLGCYYLTTFCNKSTIKNQKGSGFSFSNFSDVLNAYHRQIIDLHALVWVKFEGHLEQGNDQDDPIEIRIHSYGNWNEIYQYIQKNYCASKNTFDYASHDHLIKTPSGNLVTQYICTTPGRILFNFLIRPK